MKSPGFWRRGGAGLPRVLLTPFGMVWQTLGALKQSLSKPEDVAVPVVCIGNITVGGTGKTPTVMLVADWFRSHGVTPGVLSRGYRGTLSGNEPVLVDPGRHKSTEVGDEALLHARHAPTVIARNRPAGARLLAGMCDVILMDDGHQNQTLVKDLSLIVTDAAEGFGNGAIIPAGPLRESIARGLGRANAVIAIGDGMLDDRITRSGLPVLRGRFQPSTESRALSGAPVIGFSGIGRPEKFRETLEQIGADIRGFSDFADHHTFTRRELDRIFTEAAAEQAIPVTTAKDAARLAPEDLARVSVVEIELVLDQPDQLDRILEPILDRITKRASGAAPPSRSE
ncbi:tetraacyldisaccharide 4'-kinase [Minwuia sp.]|uniref:tetraacyldisaccharide 4'-kinase n=1 Tax=Minwuia sp. TaxID=2493630 RepID=UPI003A8E511C